MRTLFRTTLPLVLLVLSTAPAHAQRFGVQLDWGDDSDLGIGGRAEFTLGSLFASSGAFSRMYGIGSFSYFFPDCDDTVVDVDCRYWEINLNGAVPLVAQDIDPYIGGGLNLAHSSIDADGPGGDGDDTELGINLLGGLRFLIGTLSAFAEARAELGGGEQFVLTAGILLGGSR
jgi:hypothetical protein